MQKKYKNVPSIISPDGDEMFISIYSDYTFGYDFWMLNNDQGPAIKSSSGYMEYRTNGVLHNVFGPAVIFPNGDEKYYVAGFEVDKDFVQNLRDKNIHEIFQSSKDFEKVVEQISTFSSVFLDTDNYCKNIYAFGENEYFVCFMDNAQNKKAYYFFKDYKPHNLFGPSVNIDFSPPLNARANATKNDAYCKNTMYYVDGVLHRNNGPAFVYDSNIQWDNKYYPKNDYRKGEVFSTNDIDSSSIKQELYFYEGKKYSKFEYYKHIASKNHLKNDDTQKSNNDFSIANSFISSQKEGFKRVATNTVITAFINAVKSGIKSSSLEDQNKIMICSFLDSDFCLPIVKSIIGYSVPYIESLNNNSFAEIIANECRIQASEQIQKDILQQLFTFVSPALQQAFASVDINETNSFMNNEMIEKMNETISLERTCLKSNNTVK